MNCFLNERCFIGKENSIHVEGRSTQMYMTSHCFGAEKQNEFIGRCLSYYNNRHFKQSEDDSLPMALKYSTLLLPFIQSEIGKQFGYNPFPSKNIIQKLQHLTVFPSSFLMLYQLLRTAIANILHWVVGEIHVLQMKSLLYHIKYVGVWNVFL